jgi:hypothetical protein
VGSFRTMGKLPCPSCGRGVALNRDGLYRRHYATAPDGTRRLCVASSRKPPVVSSRDSGSAEVVHEHVHVADRLESQTLEDRA